MPPKNPAGPATRRVRLPVRPGVAPSISARLLDEAGKPVPVAPAGVDAVEAEIIPGKPYVFLDSAVGRRDMVHAKLEFPARYMNFDRNGTPASRGGLFVRPAAVPLVWNDHIRAYATELTVGYDFTDGRDQVLAAPKTVTFFAEGPNARIQADTIVITRGGTAGYQRVVLSTTQLEGAALFTARAGPFDELKASAGILREPGGLDISVSSTQMDAFGLGTGTLALTLLARDGNPLPTAVPLVIHLSSQHVRLPSSLTLRAGQASATADLRSFGYGADEIHAESGTLTASIPVRLVFPVAPILGAIAGGAMGGAARYLKNRGRKSSLLTRRLVEGMLVGLLFVGAAWAGLVGIELSPGLIETPFGAFVLAGLSGYVGCALLDRVTKKTFSQLETA